MMAEEAHEMMGRTELHCPYCTGAAEPQGREMHRSVDCPHRPKARRIYVEYASQVLAFEPSIACSEAERDAGVGPKWIARLVDSGTREAAWVRRTHERMARSENTDRWRDQLLELNGRAYAHGAAR